jgi:hypothetical protein
MSTDRRGAEAGVSTRADGPSDVWDGSPPTLESTLVTYTDTPDRRTVYPPGLSSVSRMSAWLTADDAAFVRLSEMR